MNDNIRYHIDVTPEEDKLFRDEAPAMTNEVTKYGFFKKSFFVSVTIHVILAAMITAYASNENQKGIKEPEPLSVVSPTTTTISSNAMVQATPQKPLVHSVSKETNLTTMYTIKQGDTVYSISKKYKLNVDKLLKLNNIKDPNKIVVGQQLKFL